MFKAILAQRAEKEFGKLPRLLQIRFYQEFKNLESGIFISNLDVKKIKGAKNGYRFRVGRRRILFAVDNKEKTIEIVDIFLKKGRQDYQKRRGLFYK